MARHFNDLTPAQAERLALLSEELGEAIQAIGKILRHGYDSVDPTADNPSHNQTDLEHELGDIQFCIELLCATGDLSEETIDQFRTEKANKVWEW